jgi:hypothetical protein
MNNKLLLEIGHMVEFIDWKIDEVQKKSSNPTPLLMKSSK